MSDMVTFKAPPATGRRLESIRAYLLRVGGEGARVSMSAAVRWAIRLAARRLDRAAAKARRPRKRGEKA